MGIRGFPREPRDEDVGGYEVNLLYPPPPPHADVESVEGDARLLSPLL